MNQPSNNHLAFLEVTLADYGRPVLFSDTHNTALRSKYDFPSYLVSAHFGYGSLAQTTKGTFNENSEQNNIFSSREESKAQSNNSSLQSYEELFSKVRITNAQKEGRNPNEDGAQA